MKKKAVLVAGALLTGSSLFVSSHIWAADSSRTDAESMEWTRAFLKREASRNIGDTEKEINKVNKDAEIEKFNMDKAKKRFEDVVFIGDSVTEYLKEANILDSSSVLAKKGEHVNQASKHLEEIKNLKPKQVVILYGANDINYSSPETFKEEYIKLIKSIQDVDKDVSIYIQAPLPVYEKISASKDSRINNENIKLFTDKAKEAASITGAHFLSSDSLVTSDELYEPDGIHFKYGFYKKWLHFLSENL